MQRFLISPISSTHGVEKYWDWMVQHVCFLHDFPWPPSLGWANVRFPLLIALTPYLFTSPLPWPPALFLSTLYPFPFPLTSAPCLSTPCLSHFPWPLVQMYLLPVFPLFLTSTPCLSTPRLPPSPGPVKSAIISHTFLVRTQ